MLATLAFEHTEWIFFAWILANQAGVPVPAVPALLWAGALLASGRLNLVVILALSVGASLAADLVWYGLGRWRGPQALELLGRLSPKTRTFIRRAQSGFLAHVGLFQLSSRFLPELNPIAAGLAGATRLGIVRVVGYGALSALVWVAAWIGVGYLLSDAVRELATRFGVGLTVLLLGALLFAGVVRRARRHRVIRLLQRARISPEELKGRLERGENVTILDLRAPEEVAEAPYALPGALWIRPEDLSRRLQGIPRDALVVLYGRRVKWARRVALRLSSAGCGRVRPLVGGLLAWRRRGYPVEAHADAAS